MKSKNKISFKVTIAEGVSYRQFVGFVEADDEKEAREKAMNEFILQHPQYSAKFKIIMVHKMPNY